MTTTAPMEELLRPRSLVQSLSLDQKAQLTAGVSWWFTHGMPEIGMEPLKLCDGPNGIRGNDDEREPSLCTPCGTALGASFDTDLARRVGELIGDEARRREVHVVLGPTMNIHRSPLGGRGFECFSEDPLLSGHLAAEWIRGVQSRGVAACAKHFVCNDAETARTTVDNVVDERALREIYLTPFEIAMRAGAWTVMAAYNKVNGVHCSASQHLIADILRAEWGWDGLVMSDWFAHGDTVESMNAGLDLEMPGPSRFFGPAVAEAVRAGTVAEETLDDTVERVLTLAARVGRIDATLEDTEPSPATWRHEADALLAEAAAAGFVLLKNDRRLLPLAPGAVRRVAVIGQNAADPSYQGGGSAQVSLEPVPTPLDAIAERWGDSAEVVYEPGCHTYESFPGLHQLNVVAPHEPDTHGLTVEYLTEDDSTGECFTRELRNTSALVWLHGVPVPDQGSDSDVLVRVSGLLTPEEAGEYAFFLRGTGPCRLLIDGRELTTFVPPDESPFAAAFHKEDARVRSHLSADTPLLIEIEMLAAPDLPHGLWFGCMPPKAPAQALMDRAVQAAAGADVTVLVVGTSQETEREGTDRSTTALPGEQEALIQRVLAINPDTVVVVNAGTAVDMPWIDSAATVLYTWFPGQAFGAALADVLTGVREPGGRLPITIARRRENYPAWETVPDRAGQVHYRESIFVGYRHFDAVATEPAFCFGHGLGYGEFEYEDVTLSSPRLAPGESVEVGVTVRNVGVLRSKEVVQVYVHSQDSSVSRPPRELRAFRAITLDPDEAATVMLDLDSRAFSYWDERTGVWRMEPGVFEVQAGRSSRDIRLSREITSTGS